MALIQIYDTKNKLCQAKNITYAQYSLMLIYINKDGSFAKWPALLFRDAVVKSKFNDIIYLTIITKVLFGLLASSKASN
jgi:hypothetical protein